MKKRTFENADFDKRFRNEKLEKKQMNFLLGGDGDGGQGLTPPWPKP